VAEIPSVQSTTYDSVTKSARHVLTHKFLTKQRHITCIEATK
jgi:hypothetical protein